MGQAHARLRSRPLSAPDKSAIRNAATVILVRRIDGVSHVLMGQRGKTAAFMPDKFVFPGGAVDDGDAQTPLADQIDQSCAERLMIEADPALAPALVSAAIREVWEETGLALGRRAPWPTPPPEDWAGFADAGYLPSANGLRFMFRAITPPGRPRRFDARFFIADATCIANDPDDFSGAEDELSHLQWIPLDRAREYNLPFITEVVLAEVTGLIARDLEPPTVPFFDNSSSVSRFRRLG